MSSGFSMDFTVNTKDANMSIDEVMRRGKQAMTEWERTRKQIMMGIRITMNTISMMMSSYREAMSLIGMNMDPFFSALIGMVVSTVSMLLAVSTALAATGIGAAAAAVTLSIAIGLSVVTVGKLVADKAITMGIMDRLETRMRHFESQRTPIGGSF